MHDETRDAINELLDVLEDNGEWHVSSVNAKEFLSGAGFDPDDVMGAEVELTVFIPGDDDDGSDSPYKYDP